mgnify:CR=1 FL=1
MSGRDGVFPTTPPDKNYLKLKNVKKIAAGIPAATNSLKHGIKKMGLTKTIKTLTTVNQSGGFDCPGCAWPDPKHSSTFEFCENGAKAVADEGMKANVNPEFFAKHSVQKLSQKSDYWLNKQGRISEPVILREGSNNYEPISWEESFRLISKNINDSNNPINQCSIHQDELQMKPHSCINYLPEHWAPITCQIVQTCVMNPVVEH